MTTILSAADLRANVTSLLQTRLPAALTVMSAWMADTTTDPATPYQLEPPRTWQRLADFTALAERQSPAVVVTTPSVTPGRIDGDGDYSASAEVRVFCVVRGRNYDDTADRVAAYLTAIRLTLADNPAAIGARDCVWLSERYSELDAAADRTIGAGSVSVRYGFNTYGQLGNLPRNLLGSLAAPIAATTDVDVRLEDT